MVTGDGFLMTGSLGRNYRSLWRIVVSSRSEGHTGFKP